MHEFYLSWTGWLPESLQYFTWIMIKIVAIVLPLMGDSEMFSTR